LPGDVEGNSRDGKSNIMVLWNENQALKQQSQAWTLLKRLTVHEEVTSADSNYPYSLIIIHVGTGSKVARVRMGVATDLNSWKYSQKVAQGEMVVELREQLVGKV
jgi:hypothetical protein